MERGARNRRPVAVIGLIAEVDSRTGQSDPGRSGIVLRTDASGPGGGYGEPTMKTVGRLQRHGFDAAVVALALVAGIEVWVGPVRAPRAALAVMVMLWTLALLLRRRFPFAAPVFVFFLYATVSFADRDAVSSLDTGAFTLLLAFWAAGAQEEARQAVASVAIGCATVAVLIERDLWIEPSDGIEEVILGVCLAVAAFVFERRARRTAALEERAVRWEREREGRERVAVAEERRRIARDLHDVVAHGVGVMTVQAGAARLLLEDDPARAREPLLGGRAGGPPGARRVAPAAGDAAPRRARRGVASTARAGRPGGAGGAGSPRRVAGRAGRSRERRRRCRRASSWPPTGSCRRGSQTRASTPARRARAWRCATGTSARAGDQRRRARGRQRRRRPRAGRHARTGRALRRPARRRPATRRRLHHSRQPPTRRERLPTRLPRSPRGRAPRRRRSRGGGRDAAAVSAGAARVRRARDRPRGRLRDRDLGRRPCRDRSCVLVPAVLLYTLPLLLRRRFPFAAPAFAFAVRSAISFSAEAVGSVCVGVRGAAARRSGRSARRTRRATRSPASRSASRASPSPCSGTCASAAATC